MVAFAFPKSTCSSFLKTTLRAYRAPEALFNRHNGTAFDMWSAGCILAELFKGEPLFSAPNSAEALRIHIAETLGVSFDVNGVVEKDGSIPIEVLLPDGLFKFTDEVILKQIAHLSFNLAWPHSLHNPPYV